MEKDGKQLMWIQGILSENVRKQIIDLCISANDDLKLSDHFLVYPLHVSFKRSFHTDRFKEIREDAFNLLRGYGKIECGIMYPFRIADMIWLRFRDEERLTGIHDIFDVFLKEKYQIPVDEFDRNYHPHITLFRDDSLEKLDEMYDRICSRFCYEEVMIEDVIIGGKQQESQCFRIG